MTLITLIFASYIITQILVNGSIFDRIRPKYKFFHCRLCVGFWVSIIVCLIMSDINNILLVYGASYFLATQER